MSGSTPSGRLELTWANKDKALLSNEDGSYTWVAPSDRRVREVRLLRDAGAVGELDPSGERGRDNLLVRGDSLHALRSLIELPEFRPHCVGKVKLCYIDPPFNTGQAFAQYDDGLEHSTWLSMMRDRLVLIKQLLAPDGSVWVHLDDAEMAYCRVLMDEIFGRESFIGTVVWEKSDSPRMDAKAFSVRHDYILVYGRSEATALSRIAYSPEHYNKELNGRRYYTKPLRSTGGKNATRAARPNLYFALTAPDGTEVWPKLADGSDGSWRWSQAKCSAEADRIEWVRGRRGWEAYFRIFEPEEATKPPETLWLSSDVGSNRTSKLEIRKLFASIEAFSTPKPERLLQRLLQIATNPGDLVLDCFAGSGTTAAVAHKMGRRWLTVELERETVETFTAPRLEKVVSGADDGGITKDAGWVGGGGFRIVDVAPSMYDEDGGTVVVADWATDGELAEATAAQVGFAYEPDGPFCGRRGRTRMAVIDGHVSEDVVRALVGVLGKGERLALYAVGLDPSAATLLEKLRPGSKARTIPQDLLAGYRSASAWRVELNRSRAVETQLSLDDMPAASEDADDGGAG